jgi:hypothetical protein
MKTKSILFALIFIFGAFISNAQIVAKGEKFVNFGLGLGSTLYSGHHYKGQIPPISISAEYIILDGLLEDKAAVGVGGYLGFSSYKWKYETADWGWKYSNIIIGPRGYFHYNFLDKLDTYTGILLGYNISTSKEYGNIVPGYDFSSSNGGVVWSWFVGGRYYFSDKFAAMAELGYGISYLNIGVAIKL